MQPAAFRPVLSQPGWAPMPTSPPPPPVRAARTPWKTAGLVITVVVACLLLLVILARIATDDEDGTRLVVEDIIPNLESTTGNESTVRVVVFLTNAGEEDSGVVRIESFAINRTSNLAKDHQQTNVGVIEPDRTTTASANLTIPPGSYKIDVLVFEDDRLVLRVQGTVDTSGERAIQPFRQVEVEPVAEEDHRTSGLGLLAAGAALGLATVGRARFPNR